jgi:hypothetical protein
MKNGDFRADIRTFRPFCLESNIDSPGIGQVNLDDLTARRWPLKEVFTCGSPHIQDTDILGSFAARKEVLDDVPADETCTSSDDVSPVCSRTELVDTDGILVLLYSHPVHSPCLCTLIASSQAGSRFLCRVESREAGRASSAMSSRECRAIRGRRRSEERERDEEGHAVSLRDNCGRHHQAKRFNLRCPSSVLNRCTRWVALLPWEAAGPSEGVMALWHYR